MSPGDCPRARRDRRFPIRCALAFALYGVAGCDERAAQPVQFGPSDCRTVTVRVEGTGERVVSIEDMVIDRPAGIAYLSAYDRWALADDLAAGRRDLTQGGIYALSLTEAAWRDGGTATARDVTAAFRAEHDFHPHGISLHAGPDGGRTLAVVNHIIAYRDGRRQRREAIEVFDVAGDGLRHRRTIEHPLMCHPNDVFAIGEDRFLVTNDRGSCSALGNLMEDVFNLHRSYVLYFDGETVTKVATGIGFANGITVGPPGGAGLSPGQGNAVYVAATRESAIRVYAMDALLADGPPPEAPDRLIRLPAGPDNLTVTPDGTLLIAAHPNLFRLALNLWHWTGIRTAPSRLFALPTSEPAAAADTVRLLYADDGSQFSAATTAATFRGMLLAGSVTDRHLLVCRYPDA